MNILLRVIFFFLFFSVILSKNHCPTSYCNNETTLPIRFPFRLQNQQNTNNCIYVTLKCNNQGTPILNIPNWGDFFVRDINYEYYEYQTIQLYDPNNCIAKRFMNLNLSYLDDYFAVGYESYTFYSCPSELVALSNLTAIDCLSNLSNATVAMRGNSSSRVMKELYRCNEIVTTTIPVSGPDVPDFIGNQSDFVLIYLINECNDCPAGLMRECVGIAYEMMALLIFIMPALICIGCCATFMKVLRSEMVARKARTKLERT